jgi:hypothetical protein
VVQALSGNGIELGTEELEVSADLLCSLTSILDLNAREPELKVEAKAEMPLECTIV